MLGDPGGLYAHTHNHTITQIMHGPIKTLILSNASKVIRCSAGPCNSMYVAQLLDKAALKTATLVRMETTQHIELTKPLCDKIM